MAGIEKEGPQLASPTNYPRHYAVTRKQMSIIKHICEQ